MKIIISPHTGENADFWLLTEWAPEGEGSTLQSLGPSVVLFLGWRALRYLSTGWLGTGERGNQGLGTD